MSAATTAIRAEDARVQERLLKLLGETADWLFTARLEMGLHWLDTNYGSTTWVEHLSDGQPTIRGRLSASPLFWAWWNNHWHGRDQRLEACLKVEQTNGGEWVLAYTRPGAVLADKVFFTAPEFKFFYATNHLVLARGLAVDADVLRRVLNAAKAEQMAHLLDRAQQNNDDVQRLLRAAHEPAEKGQ